MTNRIGKVTVAGIGPGNIDLMAPAVKEAIEQADIMIGYKTYIDLIAPLIKDKRVIDSGMRKEIDRCRQAVTLAQEGHRVVLVSSGDPGIYGMAGILLEINNEVSPAVEVEILPGITAVSAAAASLGAPLMHDFAVISLSDLLTDWNVIKKRIDLASQADFVITLYNPKSKGRTSQIEEAVQIISQYRSPQTPVGIVKNAKREGEQITLSTLGAMLGEAIDMTTVVIIGNSNTYIQNGVMITPRGYQL
ncbi:precorrin-3B C(17)-methyltransferase [Alkaliphilus crotonatoxidans]